MAEVINRKFTSVVEKVTYPENAFYRFSQSDGSPEFDQIEIPQETAAPAVVVGGLQDGVANGGNVVELTPTMRRYQKHTYSPIVLRTPADAIDLPELDKLSYNQRQSVLESHGRRLATEVANYAAIQFAQETAATDYIIQTTGTATRANAVPGGAAGNVKRITEDDIQNVLHLFNTMNIHEYPGEIYALITPSQLDDLYKIDDIKRFDATGRLSPAVNNGLIGNLYGINWIMRHNPTLNANCVYNATNNTKIAYGAALGATETSAAIFWHSAFVRRAEGAPRLFIDEATARGQVSEFSARLKFGATKSRIGQDNKGVVSLVEATA